MELYIWVISIYIFIDVVTGKKGNCKHSRLLNHVNLEGGLNSNNYTIINNVHSMPDCIQKCCHKKHCDLAMLKHNKCYNINCDGDTSCRIVHTRASTKVGGQIAFIMKPSEDNTEHLKVKRKRQRLHHQKQTIKLNKTRAHVNNNTNLRGLNKAQNVSIYTDKKFNKNNDTILRKFNKTGNDEPFVYNKTKLTENQTRWYNSEPRNDQPQINNQVKLDNVQIQGGLNLENSYTDKYGNNNIKHVQTLPVSNESAIQENSLLPNQYNQLNNKVPLESTSTEMENNVQTTEVNSDDASLTSFVLTSFPTTAAKAQVYQKYADTSPSNNSNDTFTSKVMETQDESPQKNNTNGYVASLQNDINKPTATAGYSYEYPVNLTHMKPTTDLNVGVIKTELASTKDEDDDENEVDSGDGKEDEIDESEKSQTESKIKQKSSFGNLSHDAINNGRVENTINQAKSPLSSVFYSNNNNNNISSSNNIKTNNTNKYNAEYQQMQQTANNNVNVVSNNYGNNALPAQTGSVSYPQKYFPFQNQYTPLNSVYQVPVQIEYANNKKETDKNNYEPTVNGNVTSPLPSSLSSFPTQPRADFYPKYTKLSANDRSNNDSLVHFNQNTSAVSKPSYATNQNTSNSATPDNFVTEIAGELGSGEDDNTEDNSSGADVGISEDGVVTATAQNDNEDSSTSSLNTKNTSNIVVNTKFPIFDNESTANFNNHTSRTSPIHLQDVNHYNDQEVPSKYYNANNSSSNVTYYTEKEIDPIEQVNESFSNATNAYLDLGEMYRGVNATNKNNNDDIANNLMTIKNTQSENNAGYYANYVPNIAKERPTHNAYVEQISKELKSPNVNHTEIDALKSNVAPQIQYDTGAVPIVKINNLNQTTFYPSSNSYVRNQPTIDGYNRVNSTTEKPTKDVNVGRIQTELSDEESGENETESGDGEGDEEEPTEETDKLDTMNRIDKQPYSVYNKTNFPHKYITSSKQVQQKISSSYDIYDLGNGNKPKGFSNYNVTAFSTSAGLSLNSLKKMNNATRVNIGTNDIESEDDPDNESDADDSETLNYSTKSKYNGDNATIGESLFSSTKQEDTSISKMKEELNASSGEEKEVDEEDEDEKKDINLNNKEYQEEEKEIKNDLKNIQESYDSIRKQSNQTPIFVMADESDTESGSGEESGSGKSRSEDEIEKKNLNTNNKNNDRKSKFQVDDISAAVYSKLPYNSALLNEAPNAMNNNQISQQDTKLYNKIQKVDQIKHSNYSLQATKPDMNQFRSKQDIKQKQTITELEYSREENDDELQDEINNSEMELQNKNKNNNIVPENLNNPYRYNWKNIQKQSNNETSASYNQLKQEKASTYYHQNPTPSTRPKQVLKPVSWSSSAITTKPEYESDENDEISGDDFASGSGESGAGSGDQSTRRSTIPWKTPPTLKLNYDKKPSKKSFLPLLNQSMEMMTKPFQKAFKSNIDSSDDQKTSEHLIFAGQHHHKHLKQVHIDDNNEEETLAARDLVSGLKPKHKHHVMINTGIKAASLLGQMLTGKARSEKMTSDEDLKQFATQMALSSPNEVHHKTNQHHEHHHEISPSFPTSSAENNYVFPWDQDDNNFNNNNLYPPEGSINFASEQNENFENRNTFPTHEEENHRTGQITNDIMPQGDNSISYKEAINGKNLAQGNRFPEFNKENDFSAPQGFPEQTELNTVPTKNEINDENVKAPTYNGFSQMNQVYENPEVNGYNGIDQVNRESTAQDQETETNGMIGMQGGNAINTVPSVNEELSKIPGIEKISGINGLANTNMLSPQEPFAQRHIEAMDNGVDMRDLSATNKFNSFHNFRNFGKEKHPILSLDPHNSRQPAVITMGKKKDKLNNPANLTESYKEDKKSKHSMISAFIHIPSENALKINITDNPVDDEKSNIIANPEVDFKLEKENFENRNSKLNTIKDHDSDEASFSENSTALSNNVSDNLELTKSNNSENKKDSKGTHIPWKTDGKKMKPVPSDNKNDSSNSSTNSKNKFSEDSDQNKTTHEKSKDLTEYNTKEFLSVSNDWKEIQVQPRVKKKSPFKKSSTRLSTKVAAEDTVRKLSQELRRTAKSKQIIPDHQFFHALKQVLVNKLHSLNNDDVAISKAISDFSSRSTVGKRLMKKRNKESILKQKVGKFETKQSKIVKDHPNKDARLLLANNKKKTKKGRHVKSGRYKTHKKKTKDKVVPFSVDYNAFNQKTAKSTHKKEKQSKRKPVIKYNHKHLHKGNPLVNSLTSPGSNQDDYGHEHPMDGHRYGGPEFDSSHKYANHDFSTTTEHNGMHDDTADNHANDDDWANRDPNNTSSQQKQQQQQQQQQPQQQQRDQQWQLPNQNQVHSVEKEKEITEKLNQFNILAASLTNKLHDLSMANGYKPVSAGNWRAFLNYQKQLDGIKQARQEVVEHYLHPDPKCNKGLTVRGATLRGGVLSGEFKSMGVVDTQRSCVELCCNSKRGCDVAMTIGRECINIKCFNNKMCTIAPVGNKSVYSDVLPVVTFVRKPKIKGKRSFIPTRFSVNEAIRQLDDYEREEIETIIHNVQYSNA